MALFRRTYSQLKEARGSGCLCMVEAFIIIAALGGLEFILWSIDHRQQKKQVELLDSIWAELAIRNAVEEEEKRGTQPEEDKLQKH
jgi:hypothetical protein